MTLEGLEKYDYLLFDWDGTLANSTPLWLDTMGLVLGEFTPDVPTQADMRHAMGDWHWLVHQGFLTEEQLPRYADRMHFIMAARRHETPLEEGAKLALGRVAMPGKRLGIVTASHAPHINEMLGIHELTDIFDVVISGDLTKKHKPDPEGVHLALTALGVRDYSQALMIGDNSRDLLAAHNAGIDGVLYLPPTSDFTHEEVLAACHESVPEYKPTAIIRSWHEFAQPNAA